MRKLTALSIVAWTFLVLAGCGGSDGSSKESTGTLTPGGGGGGGGAASGPPAAMELSTSVAPGSVLSKGGNATVSAMVTDAEGNAVADGTRVDFATDKGSVTETDLTVGGEAHATFQAGSAGGFVTITASTLNGISEDVFLEVATGDAASINFEQAVPQFIGVRGVGRPEISTLTFSILDDSGSPVPDGTTVNFAIRNPLGGGENLSQTSATTGGGRATVNLRSGTVSGTVSVLAFINGGAENIQTEGRVTIVSGRPDAEHVGLAAEFLNIAGGVTFGLQDTITAFFGDRYGNVVPDDTPVSFISECGTIGTSNSEEAFTTTTTLGQATALLQSTNPTVPNLDGLGGLGNVGLCRVVAFTPGQESFDDINGNGTFDQGIDVCTTDLDEPYIDANDNGVYDAGETFIDVDNNGVFTPADGTCQEETVVWGSANVLLSDNVAAINIRNPDGSPILDNEVPLGECRSFIFNFMDIWGNALVSGTDVEVEYEGPGQLFGTTIDGFADTNGPGRILSFTICSDFDGDPELGEATVTFTQENTGEAPGNNGFTSLSESRVLLVNAPGPEPPAPPPASPTVLFTIPADGQTNVGTNADLVVVFSEAMNPLTVSTATVSLENVTDGVPVTLGAPTASGGNTTFTFTPDSALAAGKSFELTISGTVRDIDDNLTMGADVVVDFSTQ